MPEELNLTINGQAVRVEPGTTLLEAAHKLSISIPTICLHDATQAKAICRTCVVEVEGMRVLAASCVTEAREDMIVHTNSDRVELARRTILELLASAVDLSEAPEIIAMMDGHQADPDRFPESSRREPAVKDDNPMFVRDYAKCVLCWRCVQVCAEDAQYTYAINFSGRGFSSQISTGFEKPLPESSCVFCGQCIGVCPTNALKPKREWQIEQGLSPQWGWSKKGKRRKG